jgi:hypothetical protein
LLRLMTDQPLKPGRHPLRLELAPPLLPHFGPGTSRWVLGRSDLDQGSRRKRVPRGKGSA